MVHRILNIAIFILVLICVLCDDATENDTLEKTSIGKSRGFNSDISWLNSLEQGLEKAKSENKIILLLIHKSWCKACKALKPSFTSDTTLQELSKQFVMVNLEDDEEPQDPIYAPDGGYIPRILFLTKEGKPLTDIKNEKGNDRYKYYYSFSWQVVESMKKILEAREKTNNEL